MVASNEIRTSTYTKKLIKSLIAYLKHPNSARDKADAFTELKSSFWINFKSYDELIVTAALIFC